MVINVKTVLIIDFQDSDSKVSRKYVEGIDD